MEVDTMNKFAVGTRASKITFPVGIPATMSKDDALVFAAWIVALANEGDQFERILSEVEGI